jgi:hypothetical protein
LILNKPFIQTLKTRHGLDLIQHIDSRCTEDFIQICALSSSSDLESLQAFIARIRSILITKWSVMDQKDFLYFMAGLHKELRQRNPRWTKQLNDIIALANNLVIVQVDRGIRKKPELVDDCLRGDMSALQVYLEMPKEMKMENQ